jgi:hypothetical protein
VSLPDLPGYVQYRYAGISFPGKREMDRSGSGVGVDPEDIFGGELGGAGRELLHGDPAAEGIGAVGVGDGETDVVGAGIGIGVDGIGKEAGLAVAKIPLPGGRLIAGYLHETHRKAGIEVGKASQGMIV